MNTSYNLTSLIGYIFYGDFGLLTTVPYFLLRILFPIITSFYLLQLFLLESNILKLVSFKTDKFLNKLGLSSNTLLSLVLGLGCVTVALSTLQIVDNPREKRIAQTLLCVIMPCSAQLVINTVLVFKTSKIYLFAYIIILFTFFLLLGFTLNFFFPNNYPNKSSTSRHANRNLCHFNIPRFLPLVSTSFVNSLTFIRETTIPFAIGNIIVSLMYFFGIFHWLCSLSSPIICNFLGLPTDAATIFMLCLIKKDLAASSLLSLFAAGKFSEPQIFICIVMLTLFVPCFASMVVLFKSEKKSICIAIWILCIIFSLIIGKTLSCLLMLPLPV